MSVITSALPRDANYVPIQGQGLIASKAITYAAGSTGAVGATTLFDVTGVVALRVFAFCGSDLTGSGVLEVGVANNTAALIAQTTAANIDNGEFWTDDSPSNVEALPGMSVVATDVIQTISSDTVTGGNIVYYCVWIPISTGANVEAV